MAKMRFYQNRLKRQVPVVVVYFIYPVFGICNQQISSSGKK